MTVCVGENPNDHADKGKETPEEGEENEDNDQSSEEEETSQNNGEEDNGRTPLMSAQTILKTTPGSSGWGTDTTWLLKRCTCALGGQTRFLLDHQGFNGLNKGD